MGLLGGFVGRWGLCELDGWWLNANWLPLPLLYANQGEPRFVAAY